MHERLRSRFREDDDHAGSIDPSKLKLERSTHTCTDCFFSVRSASVPTVDDGERRRCRGMMKFFSVFSASVRILSLVSLFRRTGGPSLRRTLGHSRGHDPSARTHVA